MTQSAMSFGLFCSQSLEHNEVGANPFQFLLEYAKFADDNGLDAVWVPESYDDGPDRSYLNPSVLCAAIAMVTHRVNLRGGGILIPLHHPLRIAEEWSVIDNLSSGRVGIALSPRLRPDRFDQSPAEYVNRREVAVSCISVLQKLWCGEALEAKNGVGQPVKVAMQPPSIQDRLPVWLAESSGRQVFEDAAHLGVGVLTTLEDGEDQLADNISYFRAHLDQHGFHSPSASVAVIMHTHIADTEHQATESVREYIRSRSLSKMQLNRID